MKTHRCCQTSTPSGGTASRWRRGGEVAGWILPGTALLLLPKCPACVAAYVALFSGVGISMASASNLRTAILILCAGLLLGLVVRRLCLLAKTRK